MTEQVRRLDEAGVPWTMTPGVPAFAAAAAALGRELTVPGVAQSLILTRHSRRATAMPPGEELASLAAHGTTLALHLATQAIGELAPQLAEHYSSECPVAVVARASWPDELVLRGTLATIAPIVEQALREGRAAPNAAPTTSSPRRPAWRQATSSCTSIMASAALPVCSR